jgi:urease accessory protein
MRRAIRVRAAGSWPRAAEVTSVTLVFDDRHRRRMRLLDDDGRPFLLDLDTPPGTSATAMPRSRSSGR